MSQTKALQTIDTQAVVGGFTQAELDTLKATIARGTTNEQFALFVQTCVRSGLNPFLNQIHCIVYNSEKHGPQMSIQISVEGIVALAKRHPQYRGFIASEVKENDEFEIDMVTGEPRHRITTMQRGKTVGAYCVAYREGAPNVAVVVTADQVEHLVRGRNGQMWKDYFDDMIVKHAIKRAFKRQFGIEVAEDEYVQPSGIDAIPSYEPQRRDITAEANAAAAAGEQQAQTATSDQQPAEDENTKIAELKKQMNEKFRMLGISGKEAKAAYIAEKGVVKGDTPTVVELTKLLKLMDADIAAKQAKAVDDDDLLAGFEP